MLRRDREREIVERADFVDALRVDLGDVVQSKGGKSIHCAIVSSERERGKLDQKEARLLR
jgi:hypothetical protein